MTRKKAKPAVAMERKTHVSGGNARWRGSGSGRTFQGPDALGAYIADPASAAHKDAVVYYDDDFVAVHDRFPKAAVHCLLLPRTPAYSGEQPLLLFNRCTTDAAVGAFLESTKAAAAALARSVAADLQRRFGQYSAQDAARQAVLKGEHSHDLPEGRDWSKEVLVGVHARPSMAHLHVHVLSRDMHSDKMRHRKHYNSFTTPFFVRLDEFPLAKDDPRLEGIDEGETAEGETTPKEKTAKEKTAKGETTREKTTKKVNFLKNDFTCWRCGRHFGNKFAELKRHLDVEFEAWKRE